MIEVENCYDLLPGIDQQAYQQFVKRGIDSVLKAPGFVELRASRNLLGSPQVRAVFVWKTMEDFARFNESAEGREFDAEIRKFATNPKIEIWGPSLMVPEPIRPGG